jgi:hypothetical protein
MEHSVNTGAINLECLMSRANIFFTSGYRLRGELDIGQLQNSVEQVVASVAKFRQALSFEAQNRYAWGDAGPIAPCFHVTDCDDLQAGFEALCRDSLSFHGDGRHCPMTVTVLRQRGNPNEFIVAQTCEHTYVDARGAEAVFNLVADHYNAGLAGDAAGQAAALDAALAIRTLSGKEMGALLGSEGHDRDANLAALGAYPLADDGRFVIPLDEVPAMLEQYQRERHAPLVRFHDIRTRLAECRARYPEVTQNSVICAVLAKAFHDVNVERRQVAPGHTVSFKMLSDLLEPSLRERYCGNYIAFVPVSVDGSLALPEMAKAVHDRIREFKETRQDVTIFQLTEEAVDAGIVGQETDPLSFVVTNWNNYRYLAGGQYLHGCESVRHQSGVNIAPRDALGAGLVNRPVMVVNMSAPGEACVSFFPSLRAQQENRELAGYIEGLFGNTAQLAA